MLNIFSVTLIAFARWWRFTAVTLVISNTPLHDVLQGWPQQVIKFYSWRPRSAHCSYFLRLQLFEAQAWSQEKPKRKQKIFKLIKSNLNFYWTKSNFCVRLSQYFMSIIIIPRVSIAIVNRLGRLLNLMCRKNLPIETN